MPTLIVEHEGRRVGGPLPPRLLIGRLPTNGLPLRDPGVSRLHAWIEQAADARGTARGEGKGEGKADGRGRYVITDAGSLTGTFVNGELLSGPRVLVHGDQIVIGKARLFFREASRLPAGVATVKLTAGRASKAPQKTGIVFDCVCGAPTWARWEEVGRPLQCRHCKLVVLVPTPEQVEAGSRAVLAPRQSPVAAPAVAEAAGEAVHFGADEDDVYLGTSNAALVDESPAGRQTLAPAGAGHEVAPHAAHDIGHDAAHDAQTCSICQSAIRGGEEQSRCPECGLTFHADCWLENYGCSAYGCSQVNVLKPPARRKAARGAGVGPHPGPEGEDDSHADGSHWADSVDAEAEADRFPWEFVLLAASVFAALVGALTFGAPAALAALAAVGYALRHRGRRRTGVAVLAAAIGVLGLLAGLATSWLWWYGRPIWSGLLK